MLLCGCAKLHTVVLQGNTYVDKKTGVEYTALSACYEPVMRGEEYAVMDLSGVETILYEMGDFSPEEYLCTAYNDVFCADATAVPSFDAWDVAEIYVCTTTAMTAALLVLDGEEGGVDAPLVWALRDAYVEGARVKYPSYYTVADSYTLRFTANNVPGLYYCITYVEYAEDVYDAIDGVEVNLGHYFIYDRYNKVCVAVGDALHERLGGVQYDDAEDEYDA
jgi:hypothetical protein